MRFLLKVAFWLSIVVLLLPASEKQSSGPEIRTADAVSAATAAVSDARQFCTRQPEACAVGAQAAVAFGQKAQAGAKMLYEFLNEHTSPAETGSVSNRPANQKAAQAAPASQHTLTPADLAPLWRGPETRRDAKPPV